MIMRKSALVVLPLLLLLLLLGPSSSAAEDLLYKVYANNLSDLKLDVTLCTASQCVPKSPRSFFTLGPKQVALYGPGDGWQKSYFIITDAASGKKLERNLWSGQFAPSNPANILSIVQKSKSRTEVWFSDLSGRNVLLGLLS